MIDEPNTVIVIAFVKFLSKSNKSDDTTQVNVLLLWESITGLMISSLLSLLNDDDCHFISLFWIAETVVQLILALLPTVSPVYWPVIVMLGTKDEVIICNYIYVL